MAQKEYVTLLVAVKQYRRSLLRDWQSAQKLNHTDSMKFWADQISEANDADLVLRNAQHPMIYPISK